MVTVIRFHSKSLGTHVRAKLWNDVHLRGGLPSPLSEWRNHESWIGMILEWKCDDYLLENAMCACTDIIFLPNSIESLVTQFRPITTRFGSLSQLIPIYATFLLFPSLLHEIFRRKIPSNCPEKLCIKHLSLVPLSLSKFLLRMLYKPNSIQFLHFTSIFIFGWPVRDDSCRTIATSTTKCDWHIVNYLTG